jgi:hypothetical protein
MDIERLEQGEFHPVPGPAEWFHKLDGHGLLPAVRRNIKLIPTLFYEDWTGRFKDLLLKRALPTGK